MATQDNIITLRPTKPKTPAERARAYRERKKARQIQPQNVAVPAPIVALPNPPAHTAPAGVTPTLTPATRPPP